MNCREFQRMASDLARSTPAEGGQTGEALAHLTDCMACRMRLAEERILTFRLLEASRSGYSCTVPERVDAAVFDYFEQRLRRGAVPPSSKKISLTWLAGAAAAAASVLLFWVFVRQADDVPVSSLERMDAMDRSAAIQAPAAPETPLRSAPNASDGVAAPAETVRRPIEEQAARTPPLPKTAEAAPESIDTSASAVPGFIPIPLGVNPSWREPGPVVRVEVSGAVLESMGFPIPADLYNRRTQAELMLGEDGLARAIRFAY